MATNRPSAALARKASERDLHYISTYIGSNWEMLAPFLLRENSMVTVDQIKDDHRKCQQRVFNLLLIWLKQTGDPSLAHLFHLMHKAGTSVTIEWRLIAEKLEVQIPDVRACKNGYQPPVQQPATGESMEVDQVVRSGNNNSFDFVSDQPLPAMPGMLENANNNAVNILGQQPQPMEGVQETGTNAMNIQGHGAHGGQSVADRGQVSLNRGQVNVDSGQASVDGGQSNVDGGRSRLDGGRTTVDGGLSSVDGSQPDSSHRFDEDACCYDGRLITLSEDQIKDLEKENTIPIGKGAFGNVYGSRDPSKYFHMHVAVKKILRHRQEGSIRREMITSRITHQFILPLLAVAEKRGMEFWFVFPHCQKGDLNEALKKEKINKAKRVKILLQIAIAIKYIHTRVPGVRGVILHKDISSKNVLLDDKFNARLIDFGSAREKDDITSTGGGKECYSHPDVGTGKPATESWDYYAFGVIIREMLTSLAPQGCASETRSNIYLKKMAVKDVENKVDKKIWGSNRDSEAETVKLNKIASCLLQSEDLTVEEFSKNVVDELKEIHKDFGQRCISDVTNDGKCHSCMINEKANHTSMHHSYTNTCQQKIEVCIACEKNSFLNPIECYCGQKLTPDIGSRWGALLVAGKDTDDVDVAKALTKDVMKLKKLLTSHAPRVFGIREGNVRTVVPTYPDKLNVNEELWPKVIEEVDHFTRRASDIDTLLIFFTCHGTKKTTNEQKANSNNNNNKFQLGSSSDSITHTEFNEILGRLENITKLIIILDRCYPPLVKFKKSNRVYVQINSCKETEKAGMNENGSFFTKWLIQGLKAKSEPTECKNANCRHCPDYWKKNTHFITVHNLFDYIKGHLIDNKSHLGGQTPVCSINLYDQDSNMAYYTGDRVFIHFRWLRGGQNPFKWIPLEFVKDIEELKSKLIMEFGQNVTNDKVRILKDTYRNKEKKRDCDNLDEVMFAWVHRQELEVVFDS